MDTDELTPSRPHPLGALPAKPLAALSLAAFATVTLELAPTGLLPEVAADLGVSTAAAGSLVAVWAMTIAATSILLVRSTRHLPMQRVLVGALLVSAVGGAATAAAPALGPALASRVVAAAAHGLVWSLLIPYAANLVPQERLGRAVTVVLAGPTAAAVVGIPAATAVGDRVGWRPTLVGLAGLTAVAALALHGSTRRRAVADSVPVTEPSTASGRWWRDPTAGAVLRTAVGTAAVLAGHFAAFTYVSVLLEEGAVTGSSTRPLFLLVFGTAGALGLAASGPLSDRRPASALPLATAAMAASLAGVVLLDVHVTAVWLLAVAWGASIGLLPPVFQTTLMRQASESLRGTAGAVGISALNAGIAVGAGLGGALLAGGGWRVLALVAALAASIGAAIVSPRLLRIRATAPPPATPTGSRTPPAEPGHARRA